MENWWSFIRCLSDSTRGLTCYCCFCVKLTSTLSVRAVHEKVEDTETAHFLFFED